jgi:hypothetical protein
MSTMRVEYPFGALPRDDARARLTALGEYLANKHGVTVTWSGDAATVRGKYLVVVIDGSLALEGTKAVFEGKDPGFLWRGKAKDYLTNKLAIYLDPRKKLEELPRG